MVLSNNELAIERSKFANQRTYLAYIRTGFGIAMIAGTFKKMWIIFFAILLILFSTVQYIYVNYNLYHQKKINLIYFDFLLVSFIILSIGVLYLQYNK